MILRIKLQRGRPLQRTQGKNRRLASAVGTLLIPASFMAYLLGIWRLASDLGMTGEFAITGLFSHWQVWIAVAVIVHVTASSLNRYGRGGDLHVPRLLTFRMFVPRQDDAELAERKISVR